MPAWWDIHPSGPLYALFQTSISSLDFCIISAPSVRHHSKVCATILMEGDGSIFCGSEKCLLYKNCLYSAIHFKFVSENHGGLLYRDSISSNKHTSTTGWMEMDKFLIMDMYPTIMGNYIVFFHFRFFRYVSGWWSHHSTDIGLTNRYFRVHASTLAIDQDEWIMDECSLCFLFGLCHVIMHSVSNMNIMNICNEMELHHKCHGIYLFQSIFCFTLLLASQGAITNHDTIVIHSALFGMLFHSYMFWSSSGKAFIFIREKNYPSCT